jgi:uncharacterized protein (TIGR00255 family)
MRSMTGFARASGENPRVRMEVSIRTVNHRNLDITLRVPEELRDHEAAVRKQIAEQLERGRVEVRIDLQSLNREAPLVEIDEIAIRSMRSMIDKLAGEQLIDASLRFVDLLKIPGAARAVAGLPGLEEEDIDLLRRTMGEALTRLVEAREAEGSHLQAALRRFGEDLSSLVASVERAWKEANDDLPERLRTRVQELVVGAAGLDENRLAQEVALLADRGDVQEELDRLESHLRQFDELVGGKDGPVGRRLDFLAQELFRELSTLGAKFRDPEAVRQVIDGKLLCEQIREQVQNIE